MNGQLIHTEHRSADISEYYFDKTTKLITEVKNLRFNRIRVYKYSCETFSAANSGSRLERIITSKIR